MLYRLEVENFFSIRDRQVLDLTIDANVPDPDGRFAPIFPGSDVRAPKVVAFYGANASGKTTMLRALEWVIMNIRDSVKWPEGMVNRVMHFNDAESANRSIRFAIEFGEIIDLSEEVLKRIKAGEPCKYGTYRYELELEVREDAIVGIAREVLRQKSNGKGKWQRVFERDASNYIRDSRFFSLSGFQHLRKTLANNHSIISSFAKFQHPSAGFLIDAIGRAIPLTEPMRSITDREILRLLEKAPGLTGSLNRELYRVDVGIEGMRFENTEDGPEPLFTHTGLEDEIPWDLESHGTRQFVKIFPLMATMLISGGIAIIDEFDAAIHPNLLSEMVRWFYADSGRNPKNAQLWFSCHSASLLEDLNKEEIVICEKDRQGRTSVFSLMDVKVRRDENHYRKYLSGAYGGVPHLG